MLIDGKTLLERDALRPKDCQMKERCLVLLKEFLDYHYDERFIVDTGRLSVIEATETIKKEGRFCLS